MRKNLIIMLLFLIGGLDAVAGSLFVEAESFSDKGGWVVDQQFTDLMGSPYLLAHGAGTPVAPARTDITIPGDGVYQVWVRTYNWTRTASGNPPISGNLPVHLAPHAPLNAETAV